MMNLNNIECCIDGYGDEKFFKDNSISCGEVDVHFRDLEEKVIRMINCHPVVLGCVAWLSNFEILRALRNCEHVSIVVQKEDFLRPEQANKKAFASKIKCYYDELLATLPRYAMKGTIGSKLSVCSDPAMGAVRCAGNHNSKRNPSSPRMHNKFMIFCDYEENTGDYGWDVEIIPRAVWTGSFNMSYAATQSLENAVVFTQEEIIQAYYKEFAQIYAISEPLDWTSEWCEPEYRIGT